MQVCDWRGAFGLETTPYDLLSRTAPGLMIDVGAAVGMTTTWMLGNSPESRVTAYEPFPGNWPHFERVHGEDARVTLLKAAASDVVGSSRFHVPSVMAATSGPWAEYAGGSAGGRLTDNGEFEVETRTLDADVGADGRAIFVKIDVQGAEADVLRGARQALASHRFDLLFVEYNWLPDVLEIMAGHGYLCWDSEYVLSARGKPDLSNWDVHDERVSSTGKARLKAFPKSRPNESLEWASFIQSESDRIGSVWTNLLFSTPEASKRIRT